MLGQASAPPPFDPTDPEAQKRRRAAEWAEAPPQQREGDSAEGSGRRLTGESCAVRFMAHRLRSRAQQPTELNSAAAVVADMHSTGSGSLFVYGFCLFMECLFI